MMSTSMPKYSVTKLRLCSCALAAEQSQHASHYALQGSSASTHNTRFYLPAAPAHTVRSNGATACTSENPIVNSKSDENDTTFFCDDTAM